MNIYGIGSDIININRIKKSLKNKKFLKRIFNLTEIKKCNINYNKSNCFAKRFAAKEAFVKALGTGISKGINFNEIVVFNIKSGRPTIRLIGSTSIMVNKLMKKKKYSIFLSLSDEKSFAVATVIITL